MLGAPILIKEGILKNKIEMLRAIYLYGVSIVAFVMMIAGLIGLISSILNNIFLQPGEASSQVYYIQSIVRNASLIVVGAVVFFYHWRIVNRETHLQKGVDKNGQGKI